MSDLFKRQTLDQLCEVPDDIIDVYVVERHIWQGGTVEGEAESKRKRRAEPRTVKDFLIDPVRSLLNDVLRQLAAPYDPSSKANPIGQGWWVQAEFGSGKSHLLSFIGAVALGDKKVWDTVNELETKAKKGKRESLYQFYDNGLAKKSTGKSKGIFVAVKTLVGQGGGTIGVTDTGRKLTEYILDAVQEQYHAENGKTISVYPVEVLADRFEQDIERYRKDLGKFLKDPNFFDEEEQEDLDKFLHDLRDSKSRMVRRDCGQRLWRFYTEYLQVTPKLPGESEEVLKHTVETLIAQGYEGLLLILDEVSLFMKNRTEDQRLEDAKTLLILSNRLAKVACLPVWTICAAQQYIESKIATIEHVFGKDRLLRVPLLNNENDFYDIVLSRVRTISQPNAIEPYFEDYHKGFTWPDAIGSETFKRFFPFYKPAIDVLRAVSYNLTTLRSSVHFMHQTLKSQRKAKSNELITLWQMFDDVVSYEEDPSGTTAGMAAISSKFNDEYKAYQAGRRIIGQANKGWLKVYASRCEKILKTLFLYYIAKMQPNGLSVEEIMNSVMEWRDHDKGQKADTKDNLDHYENLLDELAKEVPQVKKAGKNFVFTPEGGGVDVKELFAKARNASDGNDAKQRDAWNQLLALDGWKINTALLTMDLARDTKSLFRDIAPAEQKDFEVEWHGRTIKGRLYMRDLLDIASKGQALPPINSPDTDHDFAVFISNRPCGDKGTELAKKVGDPRTLFWTPAQLTAQERDRLLDFAAYRELIKDYQKKDTEEAKEVVQWVANRLRDEIGSIAKVVTDSFERGQISAVDNTSMSFNCQGELPSILTPLVGHVLDGVYLSKKLKFDAPAPFNDAEAIKVINGIVKTGDIPKGTKPNQFTSAADNYGYALGIMKKDGTKQLNTKGNTFVEELDEWIETQAAQGNQNISLPTVCKNFTGLGGPNDKNYGLSRRTIDIYLLCLVREGKLRILLSGKAAATDALDYTNLADQTFNAALLNSMAKIQRIKAPEGWPVLAPFAAILLDDETLKTIQKDGDITAALDRLKKRREQKRPEVEALVERLDTLMADIGQENPVADSLASWQKFLSAKIDGAEAIAHLLNAFDTAFGYTCYADQEVKATELDDLATRKKIWEKADAFCRHEQKIRAAHRYSQLTVQKNGPVGELRDKLRNLGKKLERIEDLMESEAKLQSQLLDPLEAVQGVYRTRYLQAFDEVTGKCEEVRDKIDNLPDSQPFKAIAELVKIDALASVSVSSLKDELLCYKDGLFQSSLDRNGVERGLKERPQPEGCSLHVDEAEGFTAAAEDALEQAGGIVRSALLNMASLLRQPALHSLLEQGKQEQFIADVLVAATDEKLADLLTQCIPADPGNAKLLAEYLKKIVVRVIHLHEFQPTKTKVEMGDIESVVGEFRKFLETALDGEGKGQSTILEIK